MQMDAQVMDALELLERERGVPVEAILDALANALVSAYKRSPGAAEEARVKTFNRASKANVEKAMEAWVAANPRPVVGVKEVADHIDYAARIAGHDHVGIGGDLDGVPFTAEGLEGVDGYPLLFAELIRRGWNDSNLAKLAGGNVLRVMRRAEAVADEMKDVPPAQSPPGS